MFVKIPTNPSITKQYFNTDRAYMIANTKEMWPVFMEWYSNNKNIKNPVDTFVEQKLPKEDIYYSHLRYDGQYLPFQKIASMTFEPYSHLSLHPIYGPWLSLRAIVLGDTVQPIPMVKLTSDQRDSLHRISLEPFLWGNHAKIRKLLGVYCEATKYEFTEQQMQYHYNRVFI